MGSPLGVPQESYARVMALLRANEAKLTLLADALLEYEVRC